MEFKDKKICKKCKKNKFILKQSKLKGYYYVCSFCGEEYKNKKKK